MKQEDIRIEKIGKLRSLQINRDVDDLANSYSGDYYNEFITVEIYGDTYLPVTELRASINGKRYTYTEDKYYHHDNALCKLCLAFARLVHKMIVK